MEAGGIVRRLRDDLDRSVFLPSPPNTLRLNGWEGAVVLVAFLVLAVVLQLFRVGPSSALSSLWAEDGPVFFGGALSHDFFTAVTMSYSEYLVVMPRLIGEVGAIVPFGDAAVAINLTATLVVAVSGVAVWFASAGHIRSPYLRALLVALTVLPPVAGETVASAANVAWHTTFAVFWLLLWRPATTLGACLGGVFILFSGLSSPAAFFFAPLALLRAVAIRDRRDALLVGAFGLAIVIQLPITALSDEDTSTYLWTWNILTTFLQRVTNGAVLGVELGGSAWADWGWPFLIAISVALAVYLTVLFVRASSGRLLAAIAIVTSVVMFLASSYSRALGNAMTWPEEIHNNTGGRYALVPALLVISAALVLVDSRSRSSKGRPILAIATAAVLLVSLVGSFDVNAAPDRGGPPWPESVDAARAECAAKDLAEVPVFVAPEGWTMTVSCDRLADS
ncbi:MAG TPA: hypothetical protein VFY04_07385 [Solirubrobacterales bacterium]|nr:hypothetical protein [Solirubrobacterales bacterium]